MSSQETDIEQTRERARAQEWTTQRVLDELGACRVVQLLDVGLDHGAESVQ